MRQPKKTPTPAELKIELEEIIHALDNCAVQQSGWFGIPVESDRELVMRQYIERGSQILAQLKSSDDLKSGLDKLAATFRKLVFNTDSAGTVPGDVH
ncbi:hypothetical protein KKI23_03990 [Patescibacteria group bacterium]|nr:hypothetical protein [Patescibacteria group bacterium]